MFTKSKINDPIDPDQGNSRTDAPAVSNATVTDSKPKPALAASAPVNAKPTVGPSLISPDLVINGNLITEGDIQVEGTVEGDIRAHVLTVGETAVIRGEVIAEDIVVNGRVIGRIRGTKVRLAETARVEGDILHKTISIEAGANFEGSVKRSEDPLSTGQPKPAKATTPVAPATPSPSPAPAPTPKTGTNG